jgi:hypothetical protein
MSCFFQATRNRLNVRFILGLGGFCQSGTCKAGSTLEAAKVTNIPLNSHFHVVNAEIQALFTQNLQISIPVTVVVGLLVIAMIIGSTSHRDILPHYPLSD